MFASSKISSLVRHLKTFSWLLIVISLLAGAVILTVSWQHAQTTGTVSFPKKDRVILKPPQSSRTEPTTTPADVQDSKQQSKAAPNNRGFTFRGTVEKFDSRTQTLTVNGENVPGWMSAMIMSYRIESPENLVVKVGDHVIARVYEGDFSTLRDVRVISAGPAGPPNCRHSHMSAL